MTSLFFFFEQLQLKDTGLCVESEEAASRRGSLLVLAPCADYNRQVRSWAHLSLCSLVINIAEIPL